MDKLPDQLQVGVLVLNRVDQPDRSPRYESSDGRCWVKVTGLTMRGGVTSEVRWGGFHAPSGVSACAGYTSPEQAAAALTDNLKTLLETISHAIRKEPAC